MSSITEYPKIPYLELESTTQNIEMDSTKQEFGLDTEKQESDSALAMSSGSFDSGSFDSGSFEIVGAGYRTHTVSRQKQHFWHFFMHKPIFSMLIFSLVLLGCIFAGFMANHNPADFYLDHINQAPDKEFWFGTDYMGRDIYSIIWYGGRTSLSIGILATALLTFLGVTYGCIAGIASKSTDIGMMRAVELCQSVPVLLSLLLLTSLMGRQNILTLSFAIGITGWFALSRIVRSEIRQIRSSEYILAARCMGAGLPRIMLRHLIPNCVSAIMFVVISSISTSIAMESTLSFLGLGLPVEELSWGRMLALADRALLLNTWWVIVIPGLFLVITLLCITNIGHYFRKAQNRAPGNL